MIRNIWGVGRNYSEHAAELGNSVPKEPLIFLKAGSSAVFSEEIHLPAWAQDVHHEIEIALQFNEQLQIGAFGLALDLTERKIQGRLKANGQPWTLAKSFTNSCPITRFQKIENLSDLLTKVFSLEINGEIRQQGSPAQMVFPADRLIEFIKAHFPVCPGDLLLTGTPSGVGPLQRGDRLKAFLDHSLHHEWLIV